MDIKEDMNIEEAMKNPPMVTDLDDPTDNEGVEPSKRRNSEAGLSKISVDQLIVKSPNDNLSVSAKSSVKEVKCAKKSVVFDGSVFWLGVLQIFFGVFMMTFGVYAILHEAAMSLFASGIWTGLIAISTGIFGILATATRCCPVEERWRKLSKTLFVALSLISVALSQLVVVLSGIGLARDLNNNENNEQNQDREVSIGNPFIQSKFSIIIPENYYGILANVALLIVSALEFICALLSSYKGAKALCPCFEKEKIIYTGLPVNNSHALVNSWLGKHTPPPQLYVVTSTSTLGRGTKNSGGLSITPVFTYPPPVMAQQIMGVPLIPAPLGTIPSPIIPPSKKHHHIYSRHVLKSKTYPHRPREKTPRLSRSRSRSQSKAHEEVLTEKDVAKTYTGLDKEIAEQFIERCETKKQTTSTVSSKTSCDNSSSSSLPTASTSGSSTDTTTNSKEALVNH